MNPRFFSDSYDLVKRTLLSVTPRGKRFLAVPMFTERDAEVEKLYEKLLSVVLVPHLCAPPLPGERRMWINKIRTEMDVGNYHLFLDPDTGIRTAGRMNGDTRKFIDTEEIRLLLQGRNSTLLLCFDQSLCRGSEKEDRHEKLEDLAERNISALYFQSHASILVAASSRQVLDEWKEGILALGIPKFRLQEPLFPPLP